MKILLTAFDPFGGEKINPALEAVKLVKAEDLTAELIKLEVPTVFHKSIKTVQEAMRKHKPDAVLCVGQAGGRFQLTPERVAINLDDARIPDNEGQQPVDEPVFADGADAYFASLPIKAMVESIKAENLPAAVSNTAGTFVCNHLMYGVLYTIAKEFPQCRGGFIHVPFIPAQVVDKANTPCLSLNDIARGLTASLQAIIAHEHDVKISGGREF
ncbi:MAG: pyroglutamyl-peptidase I [Clostridiales bacterium]|mgnify:FL=1|nr:pyroglutamyl-peptidase I [Clostridiales bacterium]MDD7431983.1 pyroglutamyl-peptidase I [Clostridiales bacterium]MDY3060968.1 pyroglutamyl-peptidase I [Eubacteriales bacterium]